MRRTRDVYSRLGAILTYSCTPYLFGNVPRYGEIVAFSETSASVYVNSVLGARTHREGAASALCAAVTGYVPEYGMLLDENRFGNVLIRVKASVRSNFEHALLGLACGEVCTGVPVFFGLAPDVSCEALVALGAQLNVSGACSRFHVVGVTPDAPTLERAFGGGTPGREITLSDADLERAHRRYSPEPAAGIDFVMLGCPHYSYGQILNVARLLNGKKPSAEIWIMTSAAVKDLAERTGLCGELAELGVRVVADTCVDQQACFGHLAGAGGLSDSPKCAYYMSAFGVQVAVRDVETCVRWAVAGKPEPGRANRGAGIALSPGGPER